MYCTPNIDPWPSLYQNIFCWGGDIVSTVDTVRVSKSHVAHAAAVCVCRLTVDT